MPVSKRSKVVSLTQTSKKGRQLKAALVEKVRDCVEEYSHVYVFRISNMRNRILKEMREHWASSRIFLGKNRVMAFALGRNSDESYKPVSHVPSPLPSPLPSPCHRHCYHSHQHDPHPIPIPPPPIPIPSPSPLHPSPSPFPSPP